MHFRVPPPWPSTSPAPASLAAIRRPAQRRPAQRRALPSAAGQGAALDGVTPGVPSREASGRSVWENWGTMSLVVETDLQSIEDIVEKIMAELA